ncbi:MAG: putative DNA binding domain-containing protein [Muribaculaceae bacterium]|nr:putative DNA binding domain-containing protein [Muribaculaceae bacterium]
MTDKDKRYSELLDKQIAESKKECRSLEFKSNYLEYERLGKYISALSNGACLDGEDYSYLYFGIDDKTLNIKGTTFGENEEKAKGKQSLDLTLRREITPKINFQFETFYYYGNQRIVRLKIPKAKGEPTMFNWKAFIRVESNLTSLEQYPEWMRALYNSEIDWSSEIVEGATFADLDPKAISVAREGYKQRYPYLSDECDSWEDTVFLDKASLTIDGDITRTTLLLVGKKESVSKIPHISQIVWNFEQDGKTFGDIFSIPFVLSTTELLGRIRNYRFKIYPHNSLIPAEVWKYDTRSILEGLHNCILHQNYTLNERIIVTETNEKLVFENAGNFYYKDYTQYIEGKKRPSKYRNRALMNAMVNIKMVDTLGYGIHNLFLRQRERFLPMPDYEGSNETRVVLNMPGVVIDEDYSILLMENTSVSLTDAYLLDQLQKHRPLSTDAIRHLRKLGLIEGKKPNIFICKSIASKTGKKVEYSRHKGLDENACWHSLREALKDHNSLSRPEIDTLLWNNLSDQLSDSQKKDKVKNLLAKWKRSGKIINERIGSNSVWILGKIAIDNK